jgi:hypothetical protein
MNIVNLCQDVYKKTLAYELEKVKINEDGSTTHLHSDKFLAEHPERKNSPEFTDEEETEQIKFLAALAQIGLRRNKED